VLLVEDDASVRAATSMLLRVEGYRVTAVASLAEAVRAAAQEAPELLVTDYHLAGGELGTEVITAVRGRVRSDLQAILLTGDTAVIKQVRSDPNLRILGKPVEAEELLRLLHGLLGE
jgi:CheY-like chemotaxis protein